MGTRSEKPGFSDLAESQAIIGMLAEGFAGIALGELASRYPRIPAAGPQRGSSAAYFARIFLFPARWKKTVSF